MTEIRVSCRAKAVVSIDDLRDFQGELKSLDESNYMRLKSEILDRGFSYAVHVWPNDDKLFILDGHQRIKVVKRMLEDGFSIEGIPVVEVNARSYKEAKAMLLAAASQYGRITEQGLYDFLGEAGLDWREVAERNNFHEIDWSEFTESFYGQTAPDFDVISVDDVKENQNVIVKCETIEDAQKVKELLGSDSNKVSLEKLLSHFLISCSGDEELAKLRDYFGSEVNKITFEEFSEKAGLE